MAHQEQVKSMSILEGLCIGSVLSVVIEILLVTKLQNRQITRQATLELRLVIYYKHSIELFKYTITAQSDK